MFIFLVRWISLQLHVLNSPFSQEQAELLNQLLPTLTEQQKIWLTGYLSAQAALAGSENTALAPSPSAAAPAQPVSKDVTVLYGSQTGNSEGLAKRQRSILKRKVFK